MDGRIAELIEGNCFEQSLYEAALRNLADTENKLRFNNFAYAMRELSRHILHRLAPDEEVQKCIWFKNITGRKGVIARSERANYATQGGLSNHYVTKVLRLDLTNAHKALQKAIDDLSRYTHIEEGVFDLSPEVVDQLATETTEAFAGLAEAIATCRAQVVTRLEDAIEESAVAEVLKETLLAVDEISTHHSVDEVYVDSAEVTKITHDTIHLIARGTVGVTLQWGSNGDLRRGDGMELDDSFCFTCELMCPASRPKPEALEVVEGTLMVDTSDWYGNSRDEEYDDIATEQFGKGLDDIPALPVKPDDDHPW